MTKFYQHLVDKFLVNWDKLPERDKTEGQKIIAAYYRRDADISDINDLQKILRKHKSLKK